MACIWINILLGKQRLVEEENEVENEDDSFSNQVVIDYSASYLPSNEIMIGENVRSNKLAMIQSSVTLL